MVNRKHLIQDTSQLIINHLSFELPNSSGIQEVLQEEIKNLWMGQVEKVTYKYIVKENEVKVQVTLHSNRGKSKIKFIL